MQKITISTILAIAVFGTIMTTLCALVATRTISNVGSIKAIGMGVYWESSCRSTVSSINWGTLGPGETKNFTIYIRNEGNVPIKLSMTTSNWNPSSASSYITLRWDKENEVLAAGSVVSAILTLSVSSSISGITSFNFDIIIFGTEYT